MIAVSLNVGTEHLIMHENRVYKNLENNLENNMSNERNEKVVPYPYIKCFKTEVA